MNTPHFVTRATFAIVLIFCGTNTARSQSASPSQIAKPQINVEVIVTDSSGNPIPTATVVMGVRSQFSSQPVDGQGHATLSLSEERWGVSAEAEGFGSTSMMIDLASADGRKIASNGVRLVLPRYTATDPAPPQRTASLKFAKPQAAPVMPGLGPLVVSNAATHYGEKFSVHDLAAYKHVTVTVHNAHTNADETYSGVPIDLVLMAAHAPTGSELRGKALTTGVVARGSDGYEALFSLAEIDPAFHSGQVIVADARDGKPLTDDGPLRIIATEDARPARWVRNLVALTVISTATTTDSAK